MRREDADEPDDEGLAAELTTRLHRLYGAEQRKVGFPGWSTPLAPELLPFLSHELNNYGDPYVDPMFAWHTKDLERELVETLADLFGAPAGDRWGYVTTGGSEGIMYGLWLGRTLHPNAVFYHSSAAHSSVAKAAALLDRQAVVIPTDDRGEMDYTGLYHALAKHPGRPAVVVASVGTTLTEAVDDVVRVRHALRHAGVREFYIHADAALSGIPLALRGSAAPAFGLGPEAADSVSISGHKFLGAPFPCGVVLTRAGHLSRTSRVAAYTGSPDPTIGSSRSGHAVLVLWHRLRTLGPSGLRRLAEHIRETAAYTERQLAAIGWEAWRSQPMACTVVLKTPPDEVLARWPLATVDGLSHIVCTPGVTRSQIDAFVADLHAFTQLRSSTAAAA
ncbi:histidine decarboxylase [Virgisporangium aliadipatigenens]|uniref:Histidine decarboxylase n=1 Tax=Virgisporangium aliadipatigenens TaxID=741659 RepID=A0A8J4DTE5_9ACTN|nr:histidine decarboxylase [Virgisporangium aliadipatigenens]GIJ50140.1 histidine decarboxylase [Virgisporangium aliadipatigenens]